MLKTNVISEETKKTNIIGKEVDKKLKDKNKTTKGFILWGIILAGYFIFVFNWMVMNSLGGSVGDSNGWIGEFFDSKPSNLLTQSVNYSITFMRGIGALFAGWLLVKVGHRYSVIIAFCFLSIATITSWSPIYALFIIGRMLMAVGGTVLIVYTQPVIASYFKKDDTKSKLNLVNALGFNLGAALAFLPFVFSGISDEMVNNWRMWSTIFAAFAILLLIVYIFVSRGENPVPRQTKENKNNSEVSFSSVLKEKRTWIFAIGFAFWLTAVVTMITLVNSVLGDLFNDNKIGILSEKWGTKIWNILFVLGLIPGVFLAGYWGTKNKARKPFIMGMLTVGVFAGLISILLGMNADTNSNSEITMFVFSMIFIFISGTCLWGIQGVILGMTYGYEGATPEKQGILLGAIWGIGYMGNTILTIILSAIKDAGTNPAWFIAIFTIMSLATVAIFSLVPETHKNGKLIYKTS